jgi:hypothetical protein
MQFYEGSKLRPMMQYKQRKGVLINSGATRKQELGEKGENQHGEEFLSHRFLIYPFLRAQ